MENAMLKNTSLCAIVRDEKMNPAGGIADFIDCTMPFVEQGVIVDTGSLDGTREILEEMSAKYPNLKIFDAKFEGYAQARNVSLEKAETKYVLVLDADERLDKEDFKEIGEEIKSESTNGLNFDLLKIFPDGAEEFGICHNPRLFDNTKGFLYKNMGFIFGEYLYEGDEKIKIVCTNSQIEIKHFIPSWIEEDIKYQNWYHSFNRKNLTFNLAPSQTKNFNLWKRRNPSRDAYKFGI